MLLVKAIDMECCYGCAIVRLMRQTALSKKHMKLRATFRPSKAESLSPFRGSKPHETCSEGSDTKTRDNQSFAQGQVLSLYRSCGRSEDLESFAWKRSRS